MACRLTGAIIRTNAGILLIGTLGTNFSEISIEIYTFSLKKIHLKMSSGKWRPCCLGLNVLTGLHPHMHQPYHITCIMNASWPLMGYHCNDFEWIRDWNDHWADTRINQWRPILRRLKPIFPMEISEPSDWKCQNLSFSQSDLNCNVSLAE